MTAFATAVQQQRTVTTNGMPTNASSLDACVDLFFNIGASRGKDILPQFIAAYVEERDTALRIVQWARDIRGGAGERELFRSILRYLESADPKAAIQLAANTPEIGRWDDLLVFTNPATKQFAFGLIAKAIQDGNGLASKWMPRKGKVAEELRAFLGYSPKRYRKTLVTLTKVVETQMCEKQWTQIEFGKVPSLAASRYRKAFGRNAPAEYAAYAEKLTKGEAKINAGAVYPYDVLKTVMGYQPLMAKLDRDVIIAQWEALPNFMGDANILPMVDVSGSMMCPAGNPKSALTCMNVAVSLGLYIADKNRGAFKDLFLTFSDQSKINHLQGDVLQKLEQMRRADWAMSTNLESAYAEILRVAVEGAVAQEDMPKFLVILSDMQFNAAVRSDQMDAQAMAEAAYKAAGYEVPKIVYWNLNAYGGAPVRFDKYGTALVSGFSPAIMQSILKDPDSMTPVAIMQQAIADARYDLK